MFAAKLVFNTNNFIQIAGEAQPGLPVNAPLGRAQYNIGFEEWLNNDFLKEQKLGYLDCYRAAMRVGVADVGLFMYDPGNGQIYSVGKLHGVQQLTNNQILGCRATLQIGGFINAVQQHFNILGDIRAIQNNPNHEYWQCFNNNNIVANPGNNFILNIRYESIEIFKIQQRRNLTTLTNGEINDAWRRLGIRYTMPEEWEQYFTPA